jgi:hypothetical protein
MKKLLPLLLLLLTPAAWALNPALGVHYISAYQATGTSLTSTSLTPTAGSIITVFYASNGTNGGTPTDTNGDTCVKSTLGNGNPILDAHQGSPYLWAYTCPSSASTSMTVTVSVTDSHLFEMEVVEIKNTTAIDVAQSAYENGVANTPGVVNNPVTPTVANDMILAVGSYSGSFTISPNGTGGSGGYTALENTAGVNSLGSGYLTGATTSATDAAMQTVAHADSLVGITLAFKGSAGSTCTHSGKTSGGALTVPTASSTVVSLKSGALATVDCSTTQYLQPTVGNFGAN